MGWPLLARCIVVGACLAGCAAIAGINDGKTIEDGEDGGDDASADVMVPIRDGGMTADSGCVAKTAVQPTGPVHATRAVVPPTLDGLFDDWACIDRIDVGPGAFQLGLPAGVMQSVSFAFQWTPNDLYFYAHAVTAAPGFDNTGSNLFENDSVHVIVGRDPLTGDAGTYRNGDQQITIDYKARVGDYQQGNPITSQTEARVAVATSDAASIDFQIEARIPVKSLGFPAATNLTAAQKLVVNIMLVDGKSGGAIGFRIWHLPPISRCPCVAGCCERLEGKQNTPTCDMRCTESLILDP